MENVMKKLQEPFPAEEIEWRVDRGQKTANGNFVFVLAYLTNRAIMNRLDEIFGPFGWRNEFKDWKEKSQLCGISVKFEGEWITKWDGSDDSNMDAVKGGLSGAMKRCAVQWGIGRYLYNLDQSKLPLKNSGDNWTSVKVKVSGKDEYITGNWDTPHLPSWALPEGYEYKGPVRTNQEPPQEPVKQNTDTTTHTTQTTSQGQGKQPQHINAKSAVIALMNEFKWSWDEVGEFASGVLNRPIKKVIADIKTEEEWKLVREAMLITKADLAS